MKQMSDRSIKGKPGIDEDGYFPSEPKHMQMKRPGDIRGFKYPDTEQAVASCQEDMVSKVSKNMPKPEYRH